MDFPKFSYDEQVLAGIAKSFNIHEMYVFGSVLREDFSEESDVDLLVVFDENAHYSLFDLMEVKENRNGKYPHAKNSNRYYPHS